MADKRTQQEKAHDRIGSGSEPSRDATKQGAPGQPKR